MCMRCVGCDTQKQLSKASLVDLRSRAESARDRLGRHRALIDRYLPLYMYLGPTDDVHDVVEFKVNELFDRSDPLSYSLSLPCRHVKSSRPTWPRGQNFRPRPRARYTCYCTMLRGARQVVCLSVTLTCRDHIGWDTSKIIPQFFSLGCLLFADPNTTDLLQGEHPKFWPE